MTDVQEKKLTLPNKETSVSRWVAFVPLLMIAAYSIKGSVSLIVFASLLLIFMRYREDWSMGSVALVREVCYAQLVYSAYAIVPMIALYLTFVLGVEFEDPLAALAGIGLYVWVVYVVLAVLNIFCSIYALVYKKFFKFPFLIRFDNFPHHEDVWNLLKKRPEDKYL